MHALAHLGPTVAYLDGSVGLEAHDGAGDFAESVPESGVLETESETDSFARRTRGVVVGLDCVETFFCAGAAVVHDLAGTPHLARVDDVALADLPARDADLVGESVEAAFHRELCLVRAEPAECSAHRVVRTHRDRRDVNGGGVVRTGRVTGCSLEHLHTDRRIRTGIADHACADRRQLSVGIASHGVFHADRVTLCVDEQALLARQGALHRALQEPRRECSLALV